MSIDSVTSPDPEVNKITGTVGKRPEAGDTYFLAVGSKRINGYRFKWGDALPDKEGKELEERGLAVKGREHLEDARGEKTVPYLRDENLFSKEENQVEVTDADGVHTPDTSSRRTSVTDSQAGNVTSEQDTARQTRTARGK